MTKERTEIILQGTRNKTIFGTDIVWEEYEFKCKPGNVKRRPCLISPYHYRLDWLMWFAAFQVQCTECTMDDSSYRLNFDPDGKNEMHHYSLKEHLKVR